MLGNESSTRLSLSGISQTFNFMVNRIKGVGASLAKRRRWGRFAILAFLVPFSVSIAAWVNLKEFKIRGTSDNVDVSCERRKYRQATVKPRQIPD